MKPKTKRRAPTKLDVLDQVKDTLSAYDELRAKLADLEALAHAAREVVLPWIADRDGRRALGRVGTYLELLADLAQQAVDEAETTAASLIHARR